MDEEMKNAILELIKEKLVVKTNVSVGGTGYINVEVELYIEGENVPFAWGRDENWITTD